MGNELTVRNAKSELPVSNITKEQAIYLLKKAWPDAPDAEVVKAAIICQQYRFHPYMKRVHLIPYQKKDKTGKVIGTTWSIVLGIGATRQMVQAKHKYGFADGPRIMTDDEQMKVFGKATNTDIVAVVKLQDRDGLVYPGYGRYPKVAIPKGVDKGNSPENMAFIRAERNALDKLAPGELPDMDVVDETYEDKPMPQLIEEGRQQVIETSEQHARDYWPEGKPVETLTPAIEAATAEAPEVPVKPKRDPATIKTTAELQRALHADFGLQPKEQLAELNITSWNELTISPANAYQIVESSRV